MDDFTLVRGGLSYGWISTENSKIYSHDPQARVMYRTYIDDGTLMNLTNYDGIITNLRIRYNPKEGNDLYLVFNEDRNTDLNRELPYLPVYNSRAVMLKYTYTFNL